MDFLTHLFLPFTVAIVLRPRRLATVRALPLAGFGLLADFDKFLGVPGLLHSLVTIVPIAVAIVAVERLLRQELYWSPIVVALVGSHLLLDFVDGGPVPLLFPLVKTGIGLEYPIRTVFGEGLFGLIFKGPLVALRTTTPLPGYNTYGFVQGAGVLNAFVFVIVFTILRERYRT